MRFDHLLHWVPDREAAVQAYREAGLHVSIGGEHPAWGTHNALCHFGLPYVEIIAFREPDRAPADDDGGPTGGFRGAARMLSRGGGAASFAVAVADLEAEGAACARRGLQVGQAEAGRRVRPDGSVVTWRTAPLLSGPAWRPFLIEWGQPDARRLEELQTRGIDAPHPLGDLRMSRIVVTSPDPQAEAAWFGRLVDRPATPEGPGWLVPLDGCSVLLVPPEQAGDPRQAPPRVARLVLERMGPGPAPALLRLFGLEIEIRP